MKAALVHDWLIGMRGGEKLLEAWIEVLTDADVYTLIYRPNGLSPAITGRRVTASALNRLPGVQHYYRSLLPLMPWFAGRMDLREYDVVVSVSHSVAHGVRVADGATFLCYCNTPMRYAWYPEKHFAENRRRGLRYRALQHIRPSLCAWDRRAAGRVGRYIACSRNVQNRIHECYGRQASVVYPPVDTDFYAPLDAPRRDSYLWVGALAPQKRLDIALDAFRKLDRKLVVIGDGPEFRKARKDAPPNVQFLGWQPDSVLREHYATCRALVFPGEEDFGIVPLEAQSCGAPVIAYGAGGVLETVRALGHIPDHAAPTGLFFDELSGAALAEAIQRFEDAARLFNGAAARDQALRFSRDRCVEALRAELSAALDGD